MDRPSLWTADGQLSVQKAVRREGVGVGGEAGSPPNLKSDGVSGAGACTLVTSGPAHHHKGQACSCCKGWRELWPCCTPQCRRDSIPHMDCIPEPGRQPAHSLAPKLACPVSEPARNFICSLHPPTTARAFALPLLLVTLLRLLSWPFLPDMTDIFDMTEMDRPTTPGRSSLPDPSGMHRASAKEIW